MAKQARKDKTYNAATRFLTLPSLSDTQKFLQRSNRVCPLNERISILPKKKKKRNKKETLPFGGVRNSKFSRINSKLTKESSRCIPPWLAVSLNMHQSCVGPIWSLQEELTCKDFLLQSADLNPTEHLYERRRGKRECWGIFLDPVYVDFCQRFPREDLSFKEVTTSFKINT